MSHLLCHANSSKLISPSWHYTYTRHIYDHHDTQSPHSTLTPRYDWRLDFCLPSHIALIDIFEGALPNIEDTMFDEEVVLVLVSAVELLVAHVALKVVVSLAQLAVTQQVALVQEQLTTRLARKLLATRVIRRAYEVATGSAARAAADASASTEHHACHNNLRYSAYVLLPQHKTIIIIHILIGTGLICPPPPPPPKRP